jgi:serine/threonine-protein kinase
MICADDGVLLVAMPSGGPQKPEDLIGQTVEGRYRVEKVLGKGGMGVVYACRHVVVGKTFAMKVLKSTGDPSEGVLARFIREAQTANAIKSRHIAEITDFGQLANGSFFVVMELLEGEDLTRALKRARLNRADMVHVFKQVATALGQAHAVGVVHRDLKPDNVFLIREGDDPLFVKLLDFGIAKVIHGEASNFTETGVILGTPYYMSPEQARGEQIDHRSDIYALGVMMYRAFTGRLPFVADSTMGVLTRHLTEAPEPPSHVTNVDVSTERVILRCMEKRPDKRYQTMAEVVHALSTLDAPHNQRLAVRDEPTVDERAHLAAQAHASQSQRVPVVSHVPTPQPWATTGHQLPAHLPTPTPMPSGQMPQYTPSPHAYPIPSALQGPHPTPPAMASQAMPMFVTPSQVPPSSTPSSVSSPPSVFDPGTSRVFSTTSRHAVMEPPKRSNAVLFLGAALMLTLGAAIALGVFVFTRPPTIITAPMPATTQAATATATAQEVTTSAAATATPATSASTDASAEPAASQKKPAGGGRPAATATPTATAKPRGGGEIRSPFD